MLGQTADKAYTAGSVLLFCRFTCRDKLLVCVVNGEWTTLADAQRHDRMHRSCACCRVTSIRQTLSEMTPALTDGIQPTVQSQQNVVNL